MSLVLDSKYTYQRKDSSIYLHLSGYSRHIPIESSEAHIERSQLSQQNELQSKFLQISVTRKNSTDQKIIHIPPIVTYKRESMNKHPNNQQKNVKTGMLSQKY
jgi:hypothetical protein